MASASEGEERADQTVPNGGDEEEKERSVRGVQSHYLRCPSPIFSTVSESRFSSISGSDADSIYMEPIHLSSAIAAKKIISEELPPRGVRSESVPESMLERAEQLMVEDLYNRVRDMIDDRSPYNTPCVLDIQRAMVQERLEAPVNPVDEVWPNIFIAEKSVAVNKARLKRMGITHILNTAHGTGVYTSESFYSGMNIQYMGIEVDDFAEADISVHFRPTAEFLDEALLTHKGKILVVSMMGISRSAVLVASYLMIFQHMTIMEALTAIRKKRPINPNEGFLKQLRDFNENLMEERDDDDETLSQCSVIDARTRALIFNDGRGEDLEDDSDTDKEDDQSMIKVKANSIMMEEETDGESVMSSIASSAAAAALRNGLIGKQNIQNEQESSTQEELVLPEQDAREDDDDGLDSMIHEWQRRNEKYQNEEWWEAQLNSDNEDEEESLTGGRAKRTKGSVEGDVESVTSEDVRNVKDRLKRRNKHPPSDVMSTSSCTSYSDLWKQRLREIEEQAAARYRKKEEKEDCDSVDTEGGEKEKRKIDHEVQSILSDTSSMYNFCQKNKEKLTPLERWRVKRIQFGWNKKENEDGEKSFVGDGEKGEGEGEAKTPSFQDVNLTAYQAWKLRQQKRLGEDNPDEILEMSRGEDSATARRRQRREELLERSKKTLEESQSMGSWETESCVSGGTIPLSAFWAGAGVTGPPSVVNDDNMSMVSGRSSLISSVSQARSAGSTQSGVPTAVPPILPVPTVQGPGGEPMVNLASIQNWIANVVTETIKQKQSEMSLPPPSRAASDVSFGGPISVISGRGPDSDKASLLSGASYSSALTPGRGKAESVLSGVSGSSNISGLSGRSSVLDSLGLKKKKITTTSVPLFSLFQDQVNLNKLDAIDKEIKSEMRGKMATYEKKKILEDNKRSTLYKKKKPKEDEEEEEERKKKEEEFLEEVKKKEKPVRTHGLSGCLNLNTALEKDKNTSIDDWLRSVRPPPRKNTSEHEAGPSEDPYDDLDASASEFDFSTRREAYTLDEDEEETYSSRYRSRLCANLSDEDTGYSNNGYMRSHGYNRTTRPYSEGNEGDDFSMGRNFSHQSSGTEGSRRRRQVDNDSDGEEDDIAAFIAQTRQRIRARAAAEAEDDEVLAAWRAQQEVKSHGRSES